MCPGGLVTVLYSFLSHRVAVGRTGGQLENSRAGMNQELGFGGTYRHLPYTWRTNTFHHMFPLPTIVLHPLHLICRLRPPLPAAPLPPTLAHTVPIGFDTGRQSFQIVMHARVSFLSWVKKIVDFRIAGQTKLFVPSAAWLAPTLPFSAGAFN